MSRPGPIRNRDVAPVGEKYVESLNGALRDELQTLRYSGGANVLREHFRAQVAA